MTKVNEPSYSAESVERALSYHERAGLVQKWTVLTGWDVPSLRSYVVRLSNGELFTLESPREAFVFVGALASARQAVRDGKANVEASW